MNSREIVQHAEENGLVIKIHPLDMAELLDSLPVCPMDIINANVTDRVDNQYIIICDKVYYQTTTVPRTGNTIV
jgi:hypothetical protein